MSIDLSWREDLDPILSPAQMCAEAGIGRATWERIYRHSLPVIVLSPRRVGCRKSVWRAALAARTDEPKAA
jgi:hypothetical protein